MRPGGCTWREFRQNAPGQNLAQLHPPLVETVDTPEATLHRHLMFVKCNQPPQAERVQPLEQDCVGRTLPRGDTMRRNGVDFGLRRALRRHFGADRRFGFPDHQGFRLREGVSRQSTMGLGAVVIGVGGQDKIHRNDPRALVHQLDEAVLGVGAGLPEQDGAGVPGGRLPGQGHALAVALHFHLLEVRRKAAQAVVVGQHALRRATQSVDVPDPNQGEQHRQIAAQRRIAEMLIHRPGTVEHRLKPGPARRQRDGQPDRRPQRIPPPDPVAETERMVRCDPERRDRRQVGGQRREMPGHRDFAQRPSDPGPCRLRVGHRFQGRERLRRDQHQGAGRIQAARRVQKRMPIHVGQKPRLHRTVGAPQG